jgi:general secretion pathway protein H
LFDPELGISLYTAAMEIESRDSGAVRFFPDGTSAGGRIRLSSETQTYDVFIDWLTGSIYVQ